MLSPDLLGLLGLSSVFFMFDWKSHESWSNTKLDTGTEKFLQIKHDKELKRIEDRYAYKNDPVSRQREIDQLIQFMEKLKAHLRNRKKFSRNPEEQSELEKMIINTPTPETKWNQSIDVSKYLIQDPETGMYYHVVRGTPELPPQMYSELDDWLRERNNSYKWDKTRGWFYNMIQIVMTGRE
jgi:hypothetical protein